MTAKRELCEDLIEKIEDHPFDILGLDKAEVDFLLLLLKKWKRESDRHKQEYAENKDYYKMVNCERYYAKKAKINQNRKRKYQVSKLEVFKK
jgi:hypothetical protein